MSKLFEWFKNITKSFKSKNSKLETERRRRDRAGSVERFVKHIWDATVGEGRMGRTLRKRAVRSGKDAKVQEATERLNRRSIRIRNLLREPGWRDIQLILEGLESKHLVNLRLPEIRDSKESLDYWYGKQTGCLEFSTEFRNELKSAIDRAESVQPTTQNEVEKIYE